MPQWEYRKIDLKTVPTKIDDVDWLNDAGRDGWELVGITSTNVAYLKRQIGEPAAAPARSTRRKSATSTEPWAQPRDPRAIPFQNPWATQRSMCVRSCP